MRRFALLAALVACRAAPAPVQPEPAIARAPARVAIDDDAPPPLKSELVAASVSTPAAIAPLPDLPAFARPDTDLEAEFPLRATIRIIGATYETASGQGAIPGDGSSGLFEGIVIDDGATTDPRRVRLLCQEPHHRIAVWLDAHDLMVSVRDQTLMVARPKLPKRVHDRTPGVRIEPGAPLLVQHRPAQGMAFVRYEGDFIDAEGFLPVRALDVVYVGERTEWTMQPNAIVIQRARVLDQPAGRELARLHGSQPDDPRWVETLGPRKGKWRLVRYEDDDVQVVGWIDKKHLRRTAGELPERSGGLGVRTNAHAHPIALPRGTRLVGKSGDEVLGIVTSDHEFECIAECRSDRPLVQVDTCTAPIEVRALFGN